MNILVTWQWVASAYLYFVVGLSFVPPVSLGNYGLIAAVVMGISTLVARSNAYKQCFARKAKPISPAAMKLLDIVSMLLLVISILAVGAYAMARFDLLPFPVHHGALVAMLAYLMFLGGKWLLAAPFRCAS